MSSETSEIIKGLSAHIDEQIRTIIYEHGVLKDKEVSALHREIRDQIKSQGQNIEELKKIIIDHDAFIKKVQRIVESSGYIKKFIFWVLVFVPSVAGFFAGIKYLYEFTSKQ